MPVNLSIKNVPEDLAEHLKERARKNHRSLQGELMDILEQALAREGAGKRTASQVAVKVREPRLPRNDEAAQMLREDRDRDFVAPPLARRVLTVQEARAHMRALGVKTKDEAADIIRQARDER